ncbi:MAG: phosphatase PAP2 family protein [Clostridia bacterium]|nr:phosphatase PAP2 family protein [Clostridia bacterium]
MAEWLNNTFFAFDGAVFNLMHSLAKSAGGFFTPFFKVVSFFGEGGVFFIIASLILLLFKNTRKLGLAVLLSLGIGALFTNVIIKNAVARPRPFNANQEYREFWLFVSGKEQGEFSFPSGHTNATMASMTALFICCRKKWSWLGFIFTLLMGLSRIYLVLHYTTDVIAGIIVGGISGVIGYFLVRFIYNLFDKHKDKRFCSFFLNADITKIFKKEN